MDEKLAIHIFEYCVKRLEKIDEYEKEMRHQQFLGYDGRTSEQGYRVCKENILKDKELVFNLMSKLTNNTLTEEEFSSLTTNKQQ